MLEVGSGPGVFPPFYGWGNFTAEVQKEEELHFNPRFEVLAQRHGWFWDIRLPLSSSCGEEFRSFEDKANFFGALRDSGLGRHWPLCICLLTG